MKESGKEQICFPILRLCTGNDIFANNSPNLKKHLMKTFLSSLIFLLALASFSAGAQAGKPLKRTLWVVKDSGSVVFSPYDLMDDESLIQKNFTHILMVKPTGENGFLLTKKYSMKPHLRIESSIGRLSFFGNRLSSDYVPDIKADSTCPSYSYVYRMSIAPNKLYGDRGGRAIFGGVVSGIDKKARTLKLTVYDNFSGKILVKREFELSPTVVHYYTTELHYTDVNGNTQIYADGTKNWIPADTTISAKVVVKDEYGATVPIKWFEVNHSNSMGNTFLPRFTGDELPSSSWHMRYINLRTTGSGFYVITPKVAEPLERCDYVKPLVIGGR